MQKLNLGKMPHGPRNQITDVPGVRVGHCTLDMGDMHTGVTAILPPPENPFLEKLTAAAFVWNGFGKSQGLIQIEELGTLETPILLTNTLNVGKVHDGVVSVMLEKCQKDGVTLTSVNPVVLECNDSSINQISTRPLGEKEVRQAIDTASADFAEGDVGAGRGTICYGMKGGIGSSSRQMRFGEETFTLGVLVQSNYGASADFQYAQVPEDWAECDRGSIIMVVATDLPLSHRQLKRVIKRASVGMARLGSYVGHGSGEIMVGFTTAPREKAGAFETIRILREEEMNIPFRAVGECCEEAILKSMLCAQEGRTLAGEIVPALADIMKARKKEGTEA